MILFRFFVSSWVRFSNLNLSMNLPISPKKWDTELLRIIIRQTFEHGRVEVLEMISCWWWDLLVGRTLWMTLLLVEDKFLLQLKERYSH
jgi:hypothetical protein